MVFPILFFLIVRPINQFLLGNVLVPGLNVLFLNHKGISFDSSIDNLIFKINNTNHYFSLPFNEYYVMFFVIFFSKKFLKKYLHFHILNFSIVLFAPFLYYSILFKLNSAFKIISIIQGTVNFYILIFIIFNFLTKFGPKSFRMKLIN